MSELEPEIKSGGKKDFFWVVVVLGVVVVIAGAIFTGNFLAKMFIKNDSSNVHTVVDQPGDNSYVPPDLEEPGEDLPRPDESAVADITEVQKPAKNSASDEKSKKTSADVIKTEDKIKEESPAGDTGSSITFTDVETVDVKKPAETQKKIETETLDVDELPAAKTSTVVEKKPEIKPDVKTDQTKPATSATDENVIYVLQLGMYSDRENAERMKVSIDKDTGLQSYIAVVDIDGSTKYRVQVGAFKDKENADKLGRELQIKGYRSYTSPQPAPKKPE